MGHLATVSKPLEANLETKAFANPLVRALLGVSFVVAAVSVGAWIRVPLPFSPVPVSLQTFAVMLGAAIVGRNLGLLSQLTYLLLGSLGLPIFAGTLFGPTGGYLIGFAAAALFIGDATKRRADYKAWQIALIFAAASILIYIPGVLYLAFWLNKSLSVAFVLGCLPFLPGQALKIAAATLAYMPLQRTAKRLFPY